MVEVEADVESGAEAGGGPATGLPRAVGTVVDAGGFVVTPEELQQRASR